MKKKTINLITIGTALGLGVLFLSSCTANFCTNLDKANIMFSYDRGSNVYINEEQKSSVPDGMAVNELKINDKITGLYYVQIFDYDYRTDFSKDQKEWYVSKTITDLNKTCATNKLVIPDNEFWARLDIKLLTVAWNDHYINWVKDGNSVYENNDPKKDLEGASVNQVVECLNQFGYIKFADKDLGNNKVLWTQWDAWVSEIRAEIGVNKCPSMDYINQYKNLINTKVNNVRSCITTDSGLYGNFGYNHDKVNISDKSSWADAWGRGFLEGLLVYPVGMLVETLSHSFGMNGFGQLGAILLTTLIVRTFLLLVSFKTTIGQQKMQMLQPELQKIQAKYPNANTNQMQKQRMSQEQMALYKKHKINPLGTLLVLIVQFPLFIGVWGAMQGSAALASDKVFNLYLSDSIWNTLVGVTPAIDTGWCTAFVLFFLMAASQFVSMQLPKWMQKAREKKMPSYGKLNANPAQKQQDKMKWFGYIMLVMIIIMGFTLPAAMGVYWLAGALFSCLQTVVTQLIISYNSKKKKEIKL